MNKLLIRNKLNLFPNYLSWLNSLIACLHETKMLELLVKNFFLSMSGVHKPECAFCEANVKSSVFFELSDAFLSSNISDLFNLHLKSYNELENLPQLDISFLDIIVIHPRQKETNKQEWIFDGIRLSDFYSLFYRWPASLSLIAFYFILWQCSCILNNT